MPLHDSTLAPLCLSPNDQTNLAGVPASRLDRPRLRVAAGGGTGAAVLDSVENISPRLVFAPGHYHRQYLAVARNGIWGTIAGAACGGSCLVKVDGSETFIYPMLCDMWSCQLCGPRKAAWLKRQLRELLRSGRLSSFWTLTVWTETCTAEESSRLITGWWDTLGKRLRKQYGKFSYIWLMEQTKQGYAHLHLLTSLDIEQTALSSDWRDIAGAWVVDVQPVHSDRAGDYVAKYCTQQAQQRLEPGYEHLKGRRFYSTSRDVHMEPFRALGDRTTVLNEDTGELRQVSAFRRVDVPYHQLVAGYRSRGLDPIRQRLNGSPWAVLAPSTKE